MPNYKFSDYALNYSTSRLRNLLDLHNDVVESGFPLSHAEIEAAVSHADVREYLSKLRKLGVTSVQRTHRISAFIEHPAIPRPAIVMINLNPEIYYAYENQPRTYTDLTGLNPAGRARIPFDFAALSDASSKKLIAWMNHAVRERRRTRLAHTTAGEFLRYHCDTTYALKARWPALNLLYTGCDKWPDRLRETPRRLSRWGWLTKESDRVWHERHAKAMTITEQLLLGVSMVKAPDRHRVMPPIYAFISSYERFNGEPI